MSSVITPVNVLPYSQRLRLIRSIKKLGDLITETSLLVDASPMPSHSRSTSTISAATTVVAISPISPAMQIPEEGSTPGSLTPHSHFFSLRMLKPRGTSESSPSPFSPTFSLNSPSTPVIDPETLKERKMAKVVQTLGENVPPELVFPPSKATTKGRKRSSTVSVPDYPMGRAINSAHADSTRALITGAGIVGRRRRTHARSGSRVVKHAASSSSLRAAADDEPFSGPSFIPVPALPDLVLVNAEVDELEDASTSAWGMHRKEAGWSGEWSGTVKNMEDVVRGLRDLRLR